MVKIVNQIIRKVNFNITSYNARLIIYIRIRPILVKSLRRSEANGMGCAAVRGLYRLLRFSRRASRVAAPG